MIPFDNYSIQQSTYFDFGDKRLNERASICIKTLINSQPSEGFPHIFSNQYELKAFYRLMNNKKVNPEKISMGYTIGLQQIIQEKLASATDEIVEFYQFQDTTFGSYLNRKNLDLGYIENQDDNGLVLHTSILTDQNFTPIGIADQQIILRDRQEYQKAQNRKKRSFEEKESFKWVKAMAWSVEVQKQRGIKIIHVADREGDMKEYFNYAFDNELDVIVRVRHNRLISDTDEKIWTHLRGLPIQNVVTRQFLDLAGKAYEAKCQISWTKVHLNGLEQAIHVVYLKQLENTEQASATEWAIFTTLHIEQLDEAIKVIDIYTHRWRTCEDFHKCLKSGCGMEKRQFESAHAMTNCVSILSLSALHLLRMRHLATSKDQAIEQLLNEQACKLAEVLALKYLKPVDLKECKPRTALWLTLLIGRMGGHQGIRQKGLPGWKTLWRGWTDFQKIMDGIILSKNFFET